MEYTKYTCTKQYYKACFIGIGIFLSGRMLYSTFNTKICCKKYYFYEKIILSRIMCLYKNFKHM